MDEPVKKESVKPADALGTLRVRSRMSRTALILIVVAGVIIAAILIGFIWHTVSGGIENAP